MTFKQRFMKQYKNFKSTPKEFSLKKIKDQSPISFSADKIMKDRAGSSCDDFVLCDCNLSTTGIYVIERKKKNVNIKYITEQLQSGADFMGEQLCESDRFDFLPVLVAKGMPSSQRVSVRNNKGICLQGKIRHIKHVKVNGSLEKIVP